MTSHFPSIRDITTQAAAVLAALLLALAAASPATAQPRCEDVFVAACTQDPVDDIACNAASPLSLPAFPETNGGAFSLRNNKSFNFPAGDYYFTSFEISTGSVITVNPSVRIFVNGPVTIQNNADINANGIPSDLFIIGYGGADIGTQDTFNAVIYAAGNLTLDNNNTLNGAIGAGGTITIGTGNAFTYDCESALSVDFGDMCIAPESTASACGLTQIDHIRIDHSGAGVTCAPQSLRLRACVDAGCSATFPDPVTVMLTSPLGNWSTNPLSFTGEAFVSLQVTRPGAVVLDASSSPQAINPARCFVGGLESCQMVWAEAGFIVDAPDHVAGTPAEVTIQAVRTDDSSQACTAAFANQNRPVAFWSEPVNPTAAILPTLLDNTDLPTTSPGRLVQLFFDISGTARPVLRNDDVGALRLHARFDGQGDEDGLVLEGSDLFIARPADFVLTVPGNPAATDATGPVFTTAGLPFEIEVEARNAGGARTPNFGREVTPEGVQLEVELRAPVDGQAPALEGTFNAFGAACGTTSTLPGQACGSFSWPEVGIIGITPRLASGAYLGSEDVIGTQLEPVGRFIPTHFRLSNGTLTDRVDLAACEDDFSYIGEIFRLDWRLDARNADDAITRNYDGDFARLAAEDLTLAGDETLEVDQRVIDWDAGIGTAWARVSAERREPAGPFETFRIGTAPVDADGVELDAFDIDLVDDDGVDDHGLIASTELRFGRLVIDNAVGSELGPLALPLRAEYYVDGTWQVNQLDQCTALALADDLELTSDVQPTPGPGSAPIALGAGSTQIIETDPVTLVDGRGALTFSAPGSSGWVQAQLLLDSNWWFLRNDLDDDEIYLENPSARASFGLFDGNENRILLQEVIP
ncbi:MAG: hypothetical protein RQ729_09655 [Wenzhouxiangellaceae bacterium]|nr:hypothetical protein [Wenzhouxiangellaceae bacterium]